MAEEKIFTIPLREAFIPVRGRRAKRAVTVVRDYLKKHMKSEDIKIGDSINKNIWSRGIQKPPRKVRIHAIKQDNIVYAELIGVDIKAASKEDVKKKEEKKKEKRERIKEERKERRRKTMQEEIEEESGKTVTAVDRKADLSEEKVITTEKKAEQSEKIEKERKTNKA